jgi:hypothetical protein
VEYLEFWERFRKAEDQGDVFNLKALGFDIYPMLRTRFYYQLAQELGVFDNPHPNPEPKQDPEPLDSLGVLAGRKAKVVVVPFVRKVAGVDPYSKPITDALPDALVLEHESAGEFDIQRIRALGKIKYDSYIQEQLLKQKVRDQKERWDKMVQAFASELGASLGKFDEYPAWLIRRYIAECLIFRDFFKALGTKKLYIVNAYSSPFLVVGAKLAGAKVLELQHGFISEYHPAYSYPKLRVQSAADKVLVWGKYWAKAARFPKGSMPVVVGPAENYLKAREQVSLVAKKPNSILFSSQGAVGKELFAAALSWAKLLPDFAITFRLHPNEDLADYQALEGAANLSLSHKTPTFLEVLGEHEYLVGGFSTTLYEGVSFGLKVLVLPLSGYQNVQPALDAGDMTLVPNRPSAQELKNLLLQAKPSANPYSYYAASLNTAKALRA